MLNQFNQDQVLRIKNQSNLIKILSYIISDEKLDEHIVWSNKH